MFGNLVLRFRVIDTGNLWNNPQATSTMFFQSRM